MKELLDDYLNFMTIKCNFYSKLEKIKGKEFKIYNKIYIVDNIIDYYGYKVIELKEKFNRFTLIDKISDVQFFTKIQNNEIEEIV